jgi:GR25 family glycosyltransferase involved in LPS biosynthesis
MINLSKKIGCDFTRFSGYYLNINDYGTRSRNCYKSHMDAIKSCIGLKNVLIMEDDLLIDDNLLMDLDVIMEEFNKMNGDILMFHGLQETDAKPKLIKRGLPAATHFYVVNDPQKIYEYLKKKLEETPKGCIDIDTVAYTKMHDCGYSTFITNKTYTYQGSSHSDVTDRFRDSHTSTVIKDVSI